jgi:catechol 2,3-dioxygenase-like lactoylglutathione lyase family enzyme
VLKLLTFEQEPAGRTVLGGLGATTGIRYWTVSVTHADEIVAAARAAGSEIVEGSTEVRPGVTITVVTDPDGNLVQFVDRPA